MICPPPRPRFLLWTAEGAILPGSTTAARMTDATGASTRRSFFLFEAVLALIHGGGGERRAGRLELREQVVGIGARHPLVASRPDASLVDDTALRRGHLPGTTMSGRSGTTSAARSSRGAPCTTRE